MKGRTPEPSKQFIVRFSEADRRTLDSLAEKLDRDRSEVLRMLLRSARIGPPTSIEGEL